MSKIILSQDAKNDLAEIKSYITTELGNPIAARRTAKKITQSIRILQAHPAAGPLLSSIADTDTNHRFIVSGNYMTFYRIVGNEVHVDRILYGRRDYMSTLFGETPNDEVIL